MINLRSWRSRSWSIRMARTRSHRLPYSGWSYQFQFSKKILVHNLNYEYNIFFYLGGFCGIQALLSRKNSHNIRIEFRHKYFQGLIRFGDRQSRALKHRVQSVQVPTVAVHSTETISGAVGKDGVQQSHLKHLHITLLPFRTNNSPPDRIADGVPPAGRASCSSSSSRTGPRPPWSRRTARRAPGATRGRAGASWCRTSSVWSVSSRRTWSSHCNSESEGGRREV